MKMKAIICTQYGAPDVLEVQNIERPIPADNEILIKVHASSATRADGMMRTGFPLIGRLFMGLRKPKYATTGTGFSGVVEKIGKNVTTFNVDDDVFGESTFGQGTNAQYVCVQDKGVVKLKPNHLTHQQASTICDGALTSLSFLANVVQVKPGDVVLINGASGSLGTAAVQIAKYYGADVTAVCSSSNKDMVLAIGADKVIDYVTQDFTDVNQEYDFVFDTVGMSNFSRCKKGLKSNGHETFV